jgi:60 kDa SS-A/Ro ribonucleoprotein
MSKNDALTAISTRHTAQTERADARQVRNTAGGYTFQLDDEARLRRFLILGSDAPTYYSSAAELTKDNAGVVLRMAETQPRRLVDVIVEISLAGRAPKQNATLFALAIAAGVPTDPADRAYALAQIPRVVRTGTHLFQFAEYVEQFRGWGRSLRTGVAAWYLDKSVDDLAYQLAKYRQREGWSHKDLLRLSHPLTAEPSREALFNWASGKETDIATLPSVVGAFLRAQQGDTVQEWTAAVEQGVSWEMLPDAALGKAEVWEALINRGMPMTALIRQLPRLTRLGLLHPTSRTAAQVATQLTDGERLHKARVHPVNVLVAARTYASGHGARSESTWSPSRTIVDALDAAFYASFDALEPTNKRIRVALDVSGSMGSPASGLPISCREAAGAMAMATIRSETLWDVVGFTGGGWGWGSSRSNGLTELAISPRQRLDDVLRTIDRQDYGRTDCSLPIVDATKKGLEFDVFEVWTDNETYAGTPHPHQALQQYREKTGIDAKLTVAGMTATPFSIADPTDPGMLDVVGMDSVVPTLIADFARGF